MRASIFSVFMAGLICLVSSSTCQAQTETIIDNDSRVQKISGDFKFTEGPVWDRESTLYFSDIPNQTIHSWTATDGVQSFRVLDGSCNGLRIDSEGRILVCQPTGRAVIRISRDGEVETLASSYEGKRLNSPNDLWIDPSGGIYFTDPRYGSMDDLQQGGFHVYYIPADGSPIKRVIDDLVKPNGVIGTADGKKLFVADPGAQKTYAYEITAPGVLGKRTLAADSGSDGLSVDSLGNLYVTGPSIRVFNTDAQEIASIPVPENAANMTFGGADGKTLFITARTGLYFVKLNVTDGSDPFLNRASSK
ncbi:Gluconolactonase precursor [Thalassoglobus neptunius]|uniref:Gluconolactonase n=1 Tax=Thalassoglobus neptunius TaxID=1938619 RepID=A0A5C5X0V7_9PLAN|nr:SMP-30/gluconolactonase/LRE family protein [Thalassoglobus neptunius]TWT55793.1 Gluconolactonase precursor [Thalassoglobus neptunius]